MARKIIILEDSLYKNFYPLTLLRPVYCLRPGIRSLYQVFAYSFADYKPILLCRPEIESLVSENCCFPVNQLDIEPDDEIILINGRLKPNSDLFNAINKADVDVLITSGGNLVALKVFGQMTPEQAKSINEGRLDEFIGGLQSRLEEMTIDIRFYEYLWEIVNDIERSLREDCKFITSQQDFKDSFITGASKDISMAFPGVVLVNSQEVYIARDAQVLPGAVLNASDGPIFIDSEVYIEPHTYIIGPVYIGRKTRLVGGKITSCSIGSVCRVGGEVEETIIQGYTNKYHAGFLGHAYVGEWINLGAMTTNSDLRNDYGHVKVSVNGEIIDTGSLKVGSFIGDFTKTAIGTLLNTGINIGLACNILGDGLVAEKEIPSFTWYSSRHKMEYKFNKAINTIEKTMARRDVKLSDSLRKRLEEIYKLRLNPSKEE